LYKFLGAEEIVERRSALHIKMEVRG